MGELIEQNVKDEGLKLSIEPGLTVSEILDRANIPHGVMGFVVVTVNGTELSSEQYPVLVPRESDHIGIWVRPAGGDSGKQVLRLVATIVVAVVAFKLGGAQLFADLGAKVGFEAATSQIIASAVIATVGALVIQALIPPPTLNLPGNQFDNGESYFLTGQRNSARPYQLVPVVYGRTKMVGNLATQPEIFSAGDSSLFTTVIDFGLGNTNIFNIRAGDTKIQFFNAQKVEHENTPPYADPNNPSAGLAPVPLRLMQYPLNSQELSVGLNKNNDFGTANTVPTAFSAVVELYFPQGIAYYDQNGNVQQLGVTFSGKYRKAGTQEFLPWPNGTQGYAGDEHIWFAAGAVEPGTGNPPDNPGVNIAVPTAVTANETFTITVSFDTVTYQVDTSDFRFVRASNTTDVTDQFTFVSVNEITPNRVWQYVFRAPTIGADESIQYFVATNLQEFVDAPPPDGVPYPDMAYNSNNFQVRGSNVGNPDPGEDPPPEVDPSLYDFDAGTYVRVTGYVLRTEPEHVFGDASTWVQTGFDVFIQGESILSNTSGWQDYAGIFQTGRRGPGFGVENITEYWSLKNADGSAGRVTGGANGRFYPNFPGIDPSVFAGQFSIYGNEVKPAKASIVIQFPEQGEYEIQIRRIGDTENVDDNRQYFNAAYWSRIASRGYPFNDISDGRRSILNLQRFHTMLELSLESSESVQGNLNEISATAVSRLRGHNGTQWTEPSNSRNPAWIVADLLTGYRAQQLGYPHDLQDCPGYVKEAQLNLATFRAFARHCNENVEYQYKGETLTRRRYEIDFVCSNEAPLMETISNILGMCRAALIIGQDGRLQIMMDEDRADQVRQVFTPQNSWDFKGERTFPQLPHALKVEFVSPELGYQKGETIVYRPGYDFSNATLFENLKTFGCTNWHMAAQFGMYTFGQMVLRQEKFTLKVAAESLVVQRGDVVEIANDVAALGGAAHLIVEQTAPDTFILSEEPNEYDDAHYTIKTNEGVFQGDVIGQIGRTVQLDRNFQPVKADETNVIVIGQQGLVTKKYIINTIRPLPDLSAELTLLPYDAALYTTDDGGFPEWNPGGDGDPQNPENGGNARTINLEGFSYLYYQDRQPYSISALSWDLATADTPLSGWKIQWSQAGQDVNIDVDFISAEKRSYEHRYLSNSNEFGAGTYVVIPVTQLGYDGAGDSVFVSKSVDRVPPPPPRKFRVVGEPSLTKFFWERPDAPDIGGYQLYQLRKRDNNYENINESDFSLATKIAQIDWDETNHLELFQIDRYGACYWLTCTDTSGNVSYPAYFDGLENGVPYPGLIEPFYFQPQYELPAGGTRVATVEWYDLEDPNDLIDKYELRWNPNVNWNTLNQTQFMDYVPPRNRPEGYNYYILWVDGWPEYGTWFIRAIDKFGQGGPWSVCSSEEDDYKIEVNSFDQEIFYIDRQPLTLCSFDWSVVGEDADKVNRFEIWLYPRQAEGRNYYNKEYLCDPHGDKDGEDKERRSPLRIYQSNDTSITSFQWSIDQLPRGDIYHQGQFIIMGFIDFQDTGKGSGVIDWEMEYDNEGPPCTDRFTATPTQDGFVLLEWAQPNAPDNDFCEIRYGLRADAEWDTAQVVAQLPYGNFDFIAEDRAGTYMLRYTDTSGNPGCIEKIRYGVDDGGDEEGWVLIQSIQGHLEWNGEFDGLVRVEGVSTLLMSEFVEVIDGKQTAYFYYDETTDVPTLAETRIVSETLVQYGGEGDTWEFISDWPLLSDVETMDQTNGGNSSVTIHHDVKLPGSSVWQEFTTDVFPITGTLQYRIRLVNNTPGVECGIERSRILVYAKEETNP